MESVWFREERLWEDGSGREKRVEIRAQGSRNMLIARCHKFTVLLPENLRQGPR